MENLLRTGKFKLSKIQLSRDFEDNSPPEPLKGAYEGISPPQRGQMGTLLFLKENSATL
jgi:hypothetical protein